MFAIRLVFWTIIVLVCFFLIKKHTRSHKYRWYLMLFIIACTLFSLSALIPVENAFVTFSSPQSAYSYMYMNKATLVVMGTSTAFVIGGEGKDSAYTIIPRSNTGWKLGPALDVKTSISKFSSNKVKIYVDQYKDSREYYITVYNVNGAAAEVRDSRNSKFYHLDKSSNGYKETFYTYYAYVHDLDDEYTLTVDGKTYSVMAEQD